MKTKKALKDHFLIYDDECPMCAVYSSAFIKFDFLDENCRKAYSKISNVESQHMDEKRSRNMIPLVNTITGHVDYGVASLLKILGNRWKLFKHVASTPLLVWIIKKCYNLISFNRKVIVPATSSEAGCTPTFNYTYRIAYLIFCWFVVATSLWVYSGLLTELIQVNSYTTEFAIAGGQMLFQTLFLAGMNTQKIMDYYGNLMTVALMGSIPLWIPILVHSYFDLNSYFCAIYLLFIAGFMFLEHFRRVKLLKLSSWLCASWVLYRLLLLTILL